MKSPLPEITRVSLPAPPSIVAPDTFAPLARLIVSLPAPRSTVSIVAPLATLTVSLPAPAFRVVTEPL